MSPERFEERLSDALKRVGYAYRPADVESARAEFLRRRRRRLLGFVSGAGALAAATAALVLLAGSAPPARDEPAPELTIAGDERPTLQALIRVGNAPSGMGVGAGALWVANEGDGTVSRIDPASDRVVATYEVGGSPEDVAVQGGIVWVSDSTRGVVIPLDPTGGDAGQALRIGSGGHIDLATGGGYVWVVARDQALYRIDPASRTLAVAARFSGVLGDVATGRGLVYVADLPGARLGDLAPPSSALSFDPVPFARSREGDLAASHEAVWIASPDAGALFRLDAQSFVVTAEVPLEGDYASIDVAADSVWVLDGRSEDGEAELLRLDPVTAEVVGEPIPLAGKPFDVRVGFGSVWVSRYDDDDVVRFRFGVQRLRPYPSPPPLPSPAAPPPAGGLTAIVVTPSPRPQLSLSPSPGILPSPEPEPTPTPEPTPIQS
jgi:YVTN family beta-propeller protein